MKKPSIDLLFEACGAKGPLQLQVESETTGCSHWLLNQPFALLGSRTGADVLLEADGIRPRHAYFQLVSGRLLALALDHRAPLRWPGGKGALCWIDPGASAQVEGYRVRLVGADHAPFAGQRDEDPCANGACAHYQLPSLQVEIHRAKSARAPIPLSRVLTLVGRIRVCKLRLHDPSISRVHCALLSTPKGVLAMDLCSREGIRVNGKRVRFVLLENGDSLRLGTIRLRMSWQDGSPHTATAAANQAAAHPPGFAPAGRETAPWNVAAAATPATMQMPGQQPQPNGPMGAVLMPLLSQFTTMQQQMLDQFQQSLLSVMQSAAPPPTSPMPTPAGDATQQRFLALLEDQRYQTALTILLQHSEATPDAGAAGPDADQGWANAIHYLVGQGVAQESAIANLTELLTAISGNNSC